MHEPSEAKRILPIIRSFTHEIGDKSQETKSSQSISPFLLDKATIQIPIKRKSTNNHESAKRSIYNFIRSRNSKQPGPPWTGNRWKNEAEGTKVLSSIGKHFRLVPSRPDFDGCIENTRDSGRNRYKKRKGDFHWQRERHPLFATILISFP